MAIGLETAIFLPCECKCEAMAAAKTVLPTLVSVPVMKRPGMGQGRSIYLVGVLTGNKITGKNN